ncbi:hypothetical protein RvY_06076-2 [Ramazzottius varieornatus]|uniref:Uncharacterized protein n=1 Tax=Ramazzottius varieornatus TaxID=947166 RepID=A0A1D1UXS7_RAMVA|nr:hypothetical protein RvY_06076-2 [Ramazzottius varieornatus]
MAKMLSQLRTKPFKHPYGMILMARARCTELLIQRNQLLLQEIALLHQREMLMRPGQDQSSLYAVFRAGHDAHPDARSCLTIEDDAVEWPVRQSGYFSGGSPHGNSSWPFPSNSHGDMTVGWNGQRIYSPDDFFGGAKTIPYTNQTSDLSQPSQVHLSDYSLSTGAAASFGPIGSRQEPSPYQPISTPLNQVLASYARQEQAVVGHDVHPSSLVDREQRMKESQRAADDLRLLLAGNFPVSKAPDERRDSGYAEGEEQKFQAPSEGSEDEDESTAVSVNFSLGEDDSISTSFFGAMVQKNDEVFVENNKLRMSECSLSEQILNQGILYSSVNQEQKGTSPMIETALEIPPKKKRSKLQKITAFVCRNFAVSER